MNKNPAFLFYPGDWLGGTIAFTRAQKGAYMDLLVAQFNQGGLSLSDIKEILGTDFWMWNTKLVSKFQLENGLYFNSRLAKEMSKRKLFVDSRKNNTLGVNQHNRSYDLEKRGHMENENENEYNNTIPPKLEDVKKYCTQRCNGVDASRWYDFYSSKGWMVGKNKMKNWQAAIRTWEKPVQNKNKPPENEALNKIKQWEKEKNEREAEVRKT